MTEKDPLLLKQNDLKKKMDESKKEMKDLEKKIWIEEIIHPKSRKRRLSEVRNKDQENEYIPTTEEIISEEIHDEENVLFKVIDQIIAIESEEMKPHAEILKKYLSWFTLDQINLSEYLKWQPEFEKYKLKMRFNYSSETISCRLCGLTAYIEPLILKIIKSEYNEGGYEGHYYVSSHELKVKIDTIQPIIHSISLKCDEKILNNLIEEEISKIYNIPKDLTPREKANKCNNITFQVDHLLNMQKDKGRVSSSPHVDHMCENCLNNPDFSKISIDYVYKIIKPEYIRISLI